MKLGIRLAVFVLLAQYYCGISAFADEFNDSVKGFNDAASMHRGEYEVLINSRGLALGADERNLILNLEVVIDRLAGWDGTLLFYHHADSILKIWAITGDGSFAWEKVEISEENLKKLIDGYRNGIGSLWGQIERAPKPRGIKRIKDGSDYQSVSRAKISQVLFPGDIEVLLETSSSIMIVPSLSIGSVPFSSLELPHSKRILSDITSVTVLPSLYDTNLSVPMYGSDDIEALVIGNPKFSDDPDWVLPQLPGAEKEARLISEMFNSTLLVGAEATKDNIISRIETAKIIYFATHGVASAINPLDESFLAVSGTNKRQARLTAREIQNMNLDAELVVLSACQTGLGGTEDAGIVGLARAFKIAGAKQVVVSLWNVDDSVTAELMLEFMNKFIGNGFDAAQSLRLSMNKIKELYPSPAYWAPFVVINGKGFISSN
ncbi:CHAT domain-containing protein [Amphritea japonica]|uniref:CHAT domain-containing protein n=1 Tax=Amphritea japonica TaxID=452627 RepID=UPI0003AA3CAF|nr:CHAT domain-containing protein [Amphritea japonica]